MAHIELLSLVLSIGIIAWFFGYGFQKKFPLYLAGVVFILAGALVLSGGIDYSFQREVSSMTQVSELVGGVTQTNTSVTYVDNQISESSPYSVGIGVGLVLLALSILYATTQKVAGEKEGDEPTSEGNLSDEE
jgi:sulfite exporter TauE/SafE